MLCIVNSLLIVNNLGLAHTSSLMSLFGLAVPVLLYSRRNNMTILGTFRFNYKHPFWFLSSLQDVKCACALFERPFFSHVTWSEAKFGIVLDLAVADCWLERGGWVGFRGAQICFPSFWSRIDYKMVTMSLNSSAGFFNDLGDLHEDHRHDDR